MTTVLQLQSAAVSCWLLGGTLNCSILASLPLLHTVHVPSAALADTILSLRSLPPSAG